MAQTKQCQKCGKRRILTQYRTANARVCKPCQKVTKQTAARKKHLTETYDITPEEYERLLTFQDGRCAICYGKRNYNLQVDHCHKTGKVRGLLCKTCNKRLLPACRDNTDRLRSAIRYLDIPPAFDVLGERVAPIHTDN